MIYKLEDLETWKKARDFRIEISKLCKTIPKDEKYRLSDQLIRASRSIPANIAEGYGRFHYQESIQYCRQARGSLLECKEHLYCAFDESYLDSNKLKELIFQLETLQKLLNGFIAFLRKSKSSQ